MKTLYFLQNNSNQNAWSNLMLRSFIVLAFTFLSNQLISQTTVNFDYTGAEQTWTVPAGVNSVDIEVFGAQGGAAGTPLTPGGKGGYSNGTLPVTPGQTLFIYVGGKGETVTNLGIVTGGGFNGGGNAYVADFQVGQTRGGGGGASDVRINMPVLAYRAIVAGGGGGSCSLAFNAGAGGGLDGEDGNSNQAGAGGSQSNGGSGSNLSPQCLSGDFGIGGSPDVNNPTSCAGGGGGWYGGGSGCGAGGGSGFIGNVTNGTTTSGVREGNGLVTITYLNSFSNDLCVNPTEIICNETTSGSTSGAGPDFPSCSNHPNPGGGLWYSFIGEGEDVTITTNNNGTNFNTRLSVFAGSCDELICVTENDGPGDFSTLTFFAAAGGLYRILVDGANGAEGSFELSVICGSPCENAIPLTCSFSQNGSNVNAPIATSPVCSNVPNGNGVWYSFTGNDQCVFLSTCDANGGASTTFDTQLSVYSGTCGNLSCVAYNDNANDGSSETCDTDYPSTLFFFAAAGTDYYVLVHGVNGETGNFYLDYVCYDREPLTITCPVDITIECDEALPVAATSYTEFLNQGGSIHGGQCASDISVYQISSYYGITVRPICEPQIWTRFYTVTSTLTQESVTCTQKIFRNPAPLPTIVSNGPVTISCVEDLLNINFEDLVTVTFPNLNCIPLYDVIHSDFPDQNSTSCNGNQFTMGVAVLDECHRIVETTQVFNVVNEGTQVEVDADQTVECADDIFVDISNIQVTHPCGIEGPQIQLDGPVIADPAHPNCSGNTHTYTYSFTDECGEFYSFERVYTIENEGTQVVVSPNETVECASDIDFDFGDLQITAPCGILTEVVIAGPFISDPQHPNCSGTTHTYTQSFTDECGVAHQYDKVFTIQNDPVKLIKVNPELDNIDDNSTIQLQCYGLDPNWSIPQYDESSFEATTSCGLTSTITYQFLDLGAADCEVDGYSHRYEHVWIATDECGTTDQFSFKVEIVDNVPPVLTGVPSDLTMECSEPLPFLPEVTAIDECLCAHISFSETEVPSTVCSGDKTIIRTWTAVDHCGNSTSASQHIYIEDNTAPELSLLSNLVGTIVNGSSLTTGCGLEDYPHWIFNLDKNSIDIFELCSENSSIEFNLESENSYSCVTSGYLERHTPSWVVTDDCGNQSYFSFSLQVVDNNPPVFYGSEVLYLCDGFEEGNAAAVDDCTNAEMWYEDVLVENCGPGVFTRIYNLSDDCQNSTTAEQLVIDLSENPELITLADGLELENIVYECELNSENYSGMSKDDVVPVIACLTDLDITFSETLLPNTCDNGGSKLHLLWTATTPCGYADVLEYFIDVIDNAAPYFPDFQSELELNCGDAIPSVIAEDDCNSVTMNIVENVESGDCPGESIMTRTITATDICGNATTVTQTIYWIDSEGPIFNLETSVCEDESNDPVMTYDICSENHFEAVLVKEETINNCAAYPIVEKTWKAEDDCENTTEFVQLIYPSNYSLQYEVIDQQLLDLIDDDISMIQKSDESMMNAMSQLNKTSVIAFDPCGEPVIGAFSSSSMLHDSCQNGIGETITFVWNFADVCGQIYAYSMSLDVQYDIPPVIEIEEDLNIYCTDVLPELIYNQADNMNYSVETNDQRNEDGDGDVLRIITATDVCGNVSTAVQTVHVSNTSDLSCYLDGDFTPSCNSSNNVYTVEMSGGTAPYSIQWFINGGNCTIAAEYGNTVEINVGFGLGNLRAEVTDGNGCITECKAVISCEGAGFAGDFNSGIDNFSNISTNNFEEELQVNLFPNPFLDQLTIELENNLNATTFISLINNLGKEVHRSEMNSDKVTLDLSRLPPGVYYLMIQDGDLWKSMKVVKIAR